EGSEAGFSGDFSVNGQRTDSNYYTVDGVSGNTNPGNGNPGSGNNGTLGAATALGTTQSLISVDALQEFRVESSSYSAEYGHGPGGQFSFVTRSGTNDFHGSAFDYLRNSYFDANDWFNDRFGEPISALRQNDFGGTVGGPIEIPRVYSGKDRSFFFASYEGLRLTQPKPAQILFVPDNDLRHNAPASLQPILNAYPQPTPGGIDYGGLAQFYAPYSLPSAIDSTSIRIDQTLSPKLVLFFRFGDTPSSIASRYLSALSQTQVNSRTYTLGATSAFSSTATNEFRLGYATGNSSLTSHLDAFGGAVVTNVAEEMGVGAYEDPSVTTYFSFPGEGNSYLGLSSSSNKLRQWNITDTANFSIGHHDLKLGIDYRRIKVIMGPSSPFVEALFESSNAVLTNSADGLYTEESIGSTPIFNNTSAFVQDEWRMKPRLLLSLGIRWDLTPPPTEQHGNDAYTLDGSIADPGTLTLAPRGTPLWSTYWANIAPRFGVAWSVRNTPGMETVLRAGGGVFFDSNDNLATQGYVSGIGFESLNAYASAPLPVTSQQLIFPSSVTPPYTSSEIYAFPTHLQSPYTLQWNVALQQAMGKHQSATLSYVGANGRRLVGLQSLNLAELNPNFGYVFTVPGGITSNYQALEAKFQRSVTHGVHALASYTWSHSLDYGSASEALPLTRGNSDFDVRNNFQGGLSWDLPSIAWSKILQTSLSNWGLDARAMTRSAYPIYLQGNEIIDPATGNAYYGNVDLVPDQPVYLHGPQYPGGRAINPGAFALPPNPSGLGDAPRNFVRGFGEMQINLAARRDFQIHEGFHLQFRAESFNILNHPNFGYVDPLIGDPTFGQATQMLNQSLGTVASQYQQGGPRSMQFALKLLF
ncbi:MAG: TonB-dependent receptor, partial [Silvibacterium sp.]